MLEEDHRVRVADRGLEQPLGVGGVIGRHHLQAGDVGVPGGIVLAVLGRHPGRRAIGAPEDDGTGDLPARHVKGLRRRIDNVINRLHGEVESHELDDGPQPRHGRADSEAGEAMLGDGGVDHPAGAELLQEAAADLVGALVLADLLAHQEDGLVPAHLLGHGVAQGVANGRPASRERRGRGGGSVWRPLRRRRLYRGGDLRDGRGGCRGGNRGGRRPGAGPGGEAGDGRVDLHLLGPLGHQDGLDDAFVDRLDLHGRLVGLDLGDDVAGADDIAGLDEPLGEGPLLHGGREGGHEDVAHRATPT